MDGFRRPIKRGEYANSYRPRPVTPKPVRPRAEMAPKKKPKLLLSVRFNLPRYGRWRVTKFARQYPFLAIMAGAGILIGLAFLAVLIKFFWSLFS